MGCKLAIQSSILLLFRYCVCHCWRNFISVILGSSIFLLNVIIFWRKDYSQINVTKDIHDISSSCGYAVTSWMFLSCGNRKKLKVCLIIYNWPLSLLCWHKAFNFVNFSVLTLLHSTQAIMNIYPFSLLRVFIQAYINFCAPNTCVTLSAFTCVYLHMYFKNIL